MCNTFNANMKTAIKLQLNKTLAQYIEQKHDRVSTDTIVHVEVQTTAPGIQELHVVGYFYTSILWHSHVSPWGKIYDEDTSKDTLLNCFFTSSPFNVFQ